MLSRLLIAAVWLIALYALAHGCLQLRNHDKSYFWLCNGWMVAILVKTPRPMRPFLPIGCLLALFLALRSVENDVTSILLAALHTVEAIIISTVLLVAHSWKKLTLNISDDRKSLALFVFLIFSVSPICAFARTVTRQIFHGGSTFALDSALRESFGMEYSTDLASMLMLYPIIAMTTTSRALTYWSDLQRSWSRILVIILMLIVAVGLPQLLYITRGARGIIIASYVFVPLFIYTSTFESPIMLCSLNVIGLVSNLATTRWKTVFPQEAWKDYLTAIHIQTLFQLVGLLLYTFVFERDQIRLLLLQDENQRKQKDISFEKLLDEFQSLKSKNMGFVFSLLDQVRSSLCWVEAASKQLGEKSPTEQELLISSHAYCMVLEALDFFCIDDLILNPVTTHIPSLIENIVSATSRVLEKHIAQFTFNIGRDIPEFGLVDSNRLRQCIFRLIFNAYEKLSTTNSNIMVNVRNATSSETASNSFDVEISVTETGPGLDLHQLRNLFSPFAPNKPFSNVPVGSGISLALTEKLVKIMGGRVWAVSQIGSGSTFSFCVPFMKEECSPTDRPFAKESFMESTYSAVVESRKSNLFSVKENSTQSLQHQSSNGKMSFYTSRSLSVGGSISVSAGEQLKSTSYSGPPAILLNSGLNPMPSDIGKLKSGSEDSNNVIKSAALPITAELSPAVAIDILDPVDTDWNKDGKENHFPSGHQATGREKPNGRRASPRSSKSMLAAGMNASLTGSRPRSIITPPGNNGGVNNNLLIPVKPTVKASGMCDSSAALILVVDDSSVFRQIFSRMIISTFGSIKVHEACDGPQAIDFCKIYSYKLIFMDLKMDKMDGDEALYHIRALGLTVPVVAVTAQTLTLEVENILLKAGFCEIAGKPISRDKISSLIANYVTSADILPRRPLPEYVPKRTLSDKRIPHPRPISTVQNRPRERSWSDGQSSTLISGHTCYPTSPKSTYIEQSVNESKPYHDDQHSTRFSRGSNRKESMDQFTDRPVSKENSLNRKPGTRNESNGTNTKSSISFQLQVQQDAQQSNPTPKISILVVDDSGINRSVLVRMLEKSNQSFDIVEATNGNEAIKFFSLKKFGLVFMDLEMPGMDGEEAAARLRSSGITTPIIAVTGNAIRAETFGSLRQAGIDDAVTKPVTRQKVLEICKVYLGASTDTKKIDDAYNTDSRRAPIATESSELDAPPNLFGRSRNDSLGITKGALPDQNRQLRKKS
ncbi:hypothetical protein HDU67_006373, partial [Dinochytrium kinnereticum]